MVPAEGLRLGLHVPARVRASCRCPKSLHAILSNPRPLAVRAYPEAQLRNRNAPASGAFLFRWCRLRDCAWDSMSRRAFAPANAVQKSHPCDFCRTPDVVGGRESLSPSVEIKKPQLVGLFYFDGAG